MADTNEAAISGASKIESSDGSVVVNQSGEKIDLKVPIFEAGNGIQIQLVNGVYIISTTPA